MTKLSPAIALMTEFGSILPVAVKSSLELINVILYLLETPPYDFVVSTSTFRTIFHSLPTSFFSASITNSYPASIPEVKEIFASCVVVYWLSARSNPMSFTQMSKVGLYPASSGLLAVGTDAAIIWSILPSPATSTPAIDG
ncbi:hypothetical protein DSECCO2_269220 [anaerobic digester metagenome]